MSPSTTRSHLRVYKSPISNCRKTVARARSKVARYRAQGGVTIACIAIPRQSVGEGCDGNRFRGRVHMGSGDWRVWKALFNPGKALKRSDGHKGAGARRGSALLRFPVMDWCCDAVRDQCSRSSTPAVWVSCMYTSTCVYMDLLW